MCIFGPSHGFEIIIPWDIMDAEIEVPSTGNPQSTAALAWIM